MGSYMDNMIVTINEPKVMYSVPMQYSAANKR